MALIEIDITINKPISDVFKAVTAYDNETDMKQWRSSIESIGITAGNPLRAGSMIAINKQFMGSSTFVNADILTIERNKILQLKGYYGRFPFTRTIEFTPNGRDTVVRDKVNVQAPWIWFWYTPFFNRALRSQLMTEWKALKQKLEA